LASLLAGALLILVSCSSGSTCHRASVPAGCPDLRIGKAAYDEWRPILRPAALQEIGDADYPACNHADQCGGDSLSGLGATDVWRLDGVAPARAVIAVREGTETYEIFVRRGTDPRSVRRLIAPGLLRAPG
jgi:hypothetical protein